MNIALYDYKSFGFYVDNFYMTCIKCNHKENYS